MMLLKLWNYIKGYVIIVVEGYFLEKFINICVHRQIYLWDLRRTKNNRMTLKISIKGFKLLRPVALKSRCKVRIVSKRGLPFTLNRYKGRKAFGVGAIAFVAVLYFLTSFIWNIEISGNKNVDSKIIYDKLEQYGVKPGILKFGINTDSLVNDLILDIRELSWVEVAIKGTKIKISVAERVKPPSIVPVHIPCDIYATSDGIIKSIVVKAGQDMVKAGATVKKGQLLVSGTVLNKNPIEKPMIVHSIASIKARTWYENAVTVNEKILSTERSGKIINNYSVEFFSKKINIFHDSISFKEYEKIQVKKNISFGTDIVFPFAVLKDIYYENTIEEHTIDLDEAKKIAADDAYKQCKVQISSNAEVLNSKIEFVQKKDGIVYAVATIECLEEIGYAKEIGGK